MKYAEINNDQIIKVHSSLPGGWKNISGLNTLSDLELSDLTWSGNTGWKFYPVTEEDKPTVDYRFYIVSTIQYTIDENTKSVLGSYTTTPVSTETAWEVIRKERTIKLYYCDWTQLPDAPLTEQQKTDWTTYRQALRDITNQADPFNISWPTEPAT